MRCRYLATLPSSRSAARVVRVLLCVAQLCRVQSQRAGCRKEASVVVGFGCGIETRHLHPQCAVFPLFLHGGIPGPEFCLPGECGKRFAS